jgi:hypothetical protein
MFSVGCQLESVRRSAFGGAGQLSRLVGVPGSASALTLGSQTEDEDEFEDDYDWVRRDAFHTKAERRVDVRGSS